MLAPIEFPTIQPMGNSYLILYLYAFIYVLQWLGKYSAEWYGGYEKKQAELHKCIERNEMTFHMLPLNLMHSLLIDSSIQIYGTNHIDEY